MVIEEWSDRSKPAEHNDHESLQREARYKVIWRECFAAGTAVSRFFFFVTSLCFLFFLPLLSVSFRLSFRPWVAISISQPRSKKTEIGRSK